MVVKMKLLEKWCGEYSKRWNKAQLWDSYCLVQDAWLAGFRKAKELTNNTTLGEELVEVEIHPQIGFEDKYGNRSITDKFRDDLKQHFKCDDLRISSDGVTVSFQGTFKV